MKKTLLITLITVLPILISCSTESVKSDQDEHPEVSENTDEQTTVKASLPPSFLYKDKYGKRLKLVRIMEGGACKNEEQGAVGMFMLYAFPDDVERIKQTKGESVFSDYEQIIEEFSMLALEQAVNRLDFSDDPFALDQEDAQRRLAEKLSDLFSESIADAIVEFEDNSRLTIDVVPLPDSLYFYQNGCEMPHQH